MVGVLGMAGVVITSCSPAIHVDRRWIMAVTSLLVVLLGVGTASQGALWGNPLEQHMQDVAYSPDYHSYGNLAYDDAASGDCSQANIYALKSVSLYPDGTGLNNAQYYMILGQSYAALGNYPAASKAYSDSIQIVPLNQTYENWAALFTVYGTFSSGQQFFQDALGAYPNDAPLWFWLAYFAYLHNDTADAKQAIVQALAYDPNNQTFGLISNRMASGLPLPAINLPCQ
jgi:tetratricopeptide (TPR) repeat protein